MCALAHILEAAGIPTVVIGLVPQHVERIRPPRALNVPFELGRPLGAPGDETLQRLVLHEALALGSRMDVPALVWFSGDSPVADADDEGWACPVAFAPGSTAPDDLESEVEAEIVLLRPWHDKAVARRGASAVGASGMDIVDAVGFLRAFLAEPPSVSPVDAVTVADAFKLAAEDLKLFYLEAAAAQPGGTGPEVADWFWDETAAGRLLAGLRESLKDSQDPALKTFARATLVPAERLRQRH